ncbi:MAG TPA: transposase [Pirellulales bacterium]
MQAESHGLEVWCEDEAGPFQAVPHEGASWRPEGRPARRPHEYVRGGTAKMLTLFRPADGRVRVQGATSTTNVVLHAWMKRELSEILAEPPSSPTNSAPPSTETSAGPLAALRSAQNRPAWERWQIGLTRPITLPKELPPLRMLLVLDNLSGHRTPEFVLWLFAHGVMPLYTPLGGSWLNMAESVQRILKRRALDGQHPETPDEVIARLASVANHWNRSPTPFVWGGKRAARRRRAQERRHALGGSAAFTRRPIRRRSRSLWLHPRQLTH